MMANYNKDGVAFIAYRQDMAHGISGYMPENAILARLNLTKALHADAVDQENHYWIQHYLGALHHLDGFLLVVESIVNQLNYLQNNLLSPSPCPLFPKIIVKEEGHTEPMHHPPALIGISSQRLEVEVETLLLKATGTLERVAQLVNFQCDLGGVRSFSRMLDRLKMNLDKPLHKTIMGLITEVNPIFSKTILADQKTKDCLRNAIAHRASSHELMDKGFSINWLEDGTLLAFDAELNNLPLVASVRDLARAVPYFTLQCIKSLLELAPEKSHAKAWARESTFNQQFFEPTWLNPFLHYSLLISSENKGPLVSLLRWLPGGFQTYQQHLIPEIFEMAVRPAKPK